VQPDDEIPFARGGHAQPGPAFITRAEKGKTWGGSGDELKLVENTDDFTRLVLFDTWTLNCDRYPADLRTRRPNRDNVFLSEEGAAAHKFVLKAIDHTECFTCGRDLTGRIATIDRVKDARIYGLFPEFTERLQKDVMKAGVADLLVIQERQVEEIVAGIPPQWQVDDEARKALVKLVCDRAKFVAGTITDAVWPQKELAL